jgi:PASTA domain-containing protein
MRRRFLLLGLLGVLAAASGSSAATQTAVTWGGAVKVPGTATLNTGGYAYVSSVSCGAVGDCAAGGRYRDGSGHDQAFVVREKNGSWGNAVEVPGTAALNVGGIAWVNSVSCGAVGECAAGGTYKAASGRFQAFLVNETKGSWGNAVELPGAATLSSSGGGVYSVSCAAVGACTAGGYYTDGSFASHAFLVSETNGSWGDAVEVPGTAALDSGGGAELNSVSCRAAGACIAGGDYQDGSGHTQAFVVTETNGSWGDAVEVPGTATLNSGGYAYVGSVSCGAVGACAAGGRYRDGSGHDQAFVVSETSGSWGDAVEVPGTAALNSGGNARVASLSCAAAGECAAGGKYRDGSGHDQAFVVSETNGSWSNAVEAPGTATLNGGGDAVVYSVSCGAVGACVAGGHYTEGSYASQAFVVSETNGSWGNAVEVPGTAALNHSGDAVVNSVSCRTAGACTAGGYYDDGSGHSQAFVVSSPPPCVVPKVVGKPLSAAKKRLNAAHCGVGKITRVYSKVKKGRVAAQSPKPGGRLKSGAKVALRVSKGKKP